MDNNTTTETPKNESIKTGIKVFLIILLICFLLFPITRCTLNPLCKDATIDDITINNQDEFSTSMKYTIVPKKIY
ncbi:MAG: hypothetical protein IJ008_03495 [Clostridia bacterium]|nr:hypothetical protein [Clostridia bacterium]